MGKKNKAKQKKKDAKKKGEPTPAEQAKKALKEETKKMLESKKKEEAKKQDKSSDDDSSDNDDSSEASEKEEKPAPAKKEEPKKDAKKAEKKEEPKKPAHAKKEEPKKAASDKKEEPKKAAPAKKEEPKKVEQAKEEKESDSDDSDSDDEESDSDKDGDAKMTDSKAGEKAKVTEATKEGAKESEDAKGSEDSSDGEESSDNDDDSDEDESDKKKNKGEKRKADEIEAATPPPKKQKTETGAKPVNSDETKIFVGNLSFDITDEQIKDVFKDCGEVVNIEWFSSKDGQFRGCGLLEFDSAEAANKATELNDQDVLGRAMKVNLNKPKDRDDRGDRGRGRRGDRGGRGSDRASSGPSEKPPGCTTVFLGNLSWSVTDDNVHEKFADCGPISSIRWIERDGKFSGYGFVEFSESSATDKAVALSGTDLLGRPMKVDFASDRKKREDWTEIKWWMHLTHDTSHDASRGYIHCSERHHSK